MLLANEAEITALFETADFTVAAAAISERVEIAALTRGAAGSVVIAGAQRHSVTADAVSQIIDTTGAGDQYAAGFLFGLAGGRPLDVCGRLGSMAAAEVIGHYGPRPETSLRARAGTQGLIAA